MYTVVSIFIIIVSILLVLSVLVQNSKGGGLASGLYASNQVMGVRKTADFLEKFTWGLVIALIVLSVAGTMFSPNKSAVQAGSELQEKIDNAPAGPMPGGMQTPAPAQPAQPPQPTSN